MAGNVLDQQVASVAMTVTNLHSLAASATLVKGWFSASVDNTTNDYLDYIVSGTFTSHASNRQAGTINVFVIASLNDTPLWPSTTGGTIGTESASGEFGDVYRRNSLCRHLVGIEADSNAGSVYAFPPTGIRQLFNGECPTHFGLFVTNNIATSTNAGLASSGSAIYYTPKHRKYT